MIETKRAAIAVASAVKRNGVGSEEHVEARRNLAEVKITDTIRRVVDQAPPLTAEQRDRIALALKGAAA